MANKQTTRKKKIKRAFTNKIKLFCSSVGILIPSPPNIKFILPPLRITLYYIFKKNYTIFERRILWKNTEFFYYS